MLATVEAAVASQQPGSRPRLERTLKEAENDYYLDFQKTLLVNADVCYPLELQDDLTNNVFL